MLKTFLCGWKMQHFAVANFFSSIVLCKGFFGKLSCKKSHFGSAIMGYSWPKSFVCMPYFWSTHLSLETCLNFSRGILFTNAQHLLCCYTLHIWGVASLICCIFWCRVLFVHTLMLWPLCVGHSTSMFLHHFMSFGRMSVTRQQPAPIWSILLANVVATMVIWMHQEENCNKDCLVWTCAL